MYFQKFENNMSVFFGGAYQLAAGYVHARAHNENFINKFWISRLKSASVDLKRAKNAMEYICILYTAKMILDVAEN